MTIDSSQKKRSSCWKLMQLISNIFKPRVPTTPTTEDRMGSSLSPPHRHHTTVKEPEKPEKQTFRRQNSRHLDDSVERGGSSIKIQGVENYDSGTDDVNSYTDIQTGKLQTSVTNLKALDYIRRFHERNKHEVVSLVLPPPPPPLPRPGQDRFVLK